MTAKDIEWVLDNVTRLTGRDLITFLQEERFLHREVFCNSCGHSLHINSNKRVLDGFSFRCQTRCCVDFKTYKTIRKNSFFENFTIPFKSIFKVILGYATRQPRHSIQRGVNLSKPTLLEITNKLIHLIPNVDFSFDKLGGPGKVVQVDETMLNYKCKSHRGRSATNRTDSLCMVEYTDRITRCFAVVIPNKLQTTIVPIICSQVSSHSKIHTDEHGSYRNLRLFSYLHGTVCHKYEFVNRINGVNTQGIESFHNELKLEIKRRKGIKTELRP